MVVVTVKQQIAVTQLLAFFCQLERVMAFPAAVNGIKLVKQGGTVRYTFTFTQGSKDVPVGSIFNILSVPLQSVVGTASCTDGSITLTQNTAVPSNALAGLVFSCVYDVEVVPTHRDNGEIQSLAIQVQYSGGSQITHAFYVKEITSEPVPVHTGAELDYKQYTVDINGAGDPKYYIRRSHLQYSGLLHLKIYVFVPGYDKTISTIQLHVRHPCMSSQTTTFSLSQSNYTLPFYSCFQ